MNTRKPSATAEQHPKAKKPKAKDLSPKAPAAEQVKGGPSGQPWARLKGRNS